MCTPHFADDARLSASLLAPVALQFRRWRRRPSGLPRISAARLRAPGSKAAAAPRWSFVPTDLSPRITRDVQVGNGIELEAVGFQFEPYRDRDWWRPAGVTWHSFRTAVVIIKLRRTSALLRLETLRSYPNDFLCPSRRTAATDLLLLVNHQDSRSSKA